jgi:hypothetical protein
MPEYKQTGKCTVPECNTIIKDWYGMHRHFLFRHYYDTIIIRKEGILSRCEQCGMFCTIVALTGKHLQRMICREGAKWNKRKMNLQCIRAFRCTFHTIEQPIGTVTSFSYLGRINTSQDSDRAVARRNLQKARQRWAMISHLLMCENASPCISALFYKATIQTVLLYGSETWVITNKILQLLLPSFHHHGTARRLTGRYPHPIPETDKWSYPSINSRIIPNG